MGTPFEVVARAERRSAPAGKSTMWASIRVDPTGKQLEAERAPLAIALVIDVSGSMAGDPLAHVLRSCEIVSELLDARDRLAIVTFSTAAGVRCGLTAMDLTGRAQLRAALRDIVADGSTNIHGGLEVGAGVVMTAPAGLRRALVVMSDGQPNIGVATAAGLADIVTSLGIAVSTLGFGLHHDDAVLDAMAIAGSGRYAYVPDPRLARVDLARAALAQSGIVADHLELAIQLGAGVELAQVVPAAGLRISGGGVKLPLGDVFVDEGRTIALELALDLHGSSKGALASISVSGTAPDGAQHTATTALAIDVHAGPHAVDRDGQRDVVVVLAEAARATARAHVDRRALPAAVAVLREAIARIEACDGFVAGDGSVLAEMREQLVDEIANYERRATDAERQYQVKSARAYKPNVTNKRSTVMAAVAARLVGMSDACIGVVFPLYNENSIGRSSDNEVVIHHHTLSRRHTRIVFVEGNYIVTDMGSTNGTRVNGKRIDTCTLVDGDELSIGEVVLRFELVK